MPPTESLVVVVVVGVMMMVAVPIDGARGIGGCTQNGRGLRGLAVPRAREPRGQTRAHYTMHWNGACTCSTRKRMRACMRVAATGHLKIFAPNSRSSSHLGGHPSSRSHRGAVVHHMNDWRHGRRRRCVVRIVRSSGGWHPGAVCSHGGWRLRRRLRGWGCRCLLVVVTG